MSASTPFRRMTPHVPGKLTCRTGKPPGARLSNALRAPSSRASRGMTSRFGPFFAGGAGLLGACSHFSDTLLEGAPDRALWARTSSTAILRSVHDERRPTTNAAFSSYFRLRPKRGRRNLWLHADPAERVPEVSVAERTTARTAATFSGAAADGVRLREAGM